MFFASTDMSHGNEECVSVRLGGTDDGMVPRQAVGRIVA